MISSRLTGSFLQKLILDPPTPLSPSQAVNFWSKSYQISVQMPYNWNMNGIFNGSCSIVPLVCVSINTHPRHVFKRLGMGSSLLSQRNSVCSL